MSRSVDGLRAALAPRYRVERELGRGGMATVYLATDLRHDRPVALKVLHPELATTLGAERFEREIRLAARLQHPHILTVHDSGEAAGLLWFTMPYVEGESLRARLDRERQLPVEDAIRIAGEAAQGLEYAHRHGVVHRDVKPENLLLTEDGSTLVADFGISRALAPDGVKLTATGISLGTAAYMSPEQAAGERDVDARSDVYSLATVLYEMLAGEPPFAAPTPQATIARRFTDTPRPLRELRETVPEHVERVVQAALARTAADRVPTARAFAEALHPPVTAGTAAMAGVVPAAPPTAAGPAVGAGGWRRLSPALAMLLAGLVLGAGILFAWRSSHSSGPADGPPRLAVLPFENVGDSADAYFADGITDAVRGKLTALPNVAVIARTSSEEYAHTDKPPDEIARELGVRYLLTGTVRWARNGDGPSRVQVSPELVEVDGDGAPRSTWQRSFDAPLTDVFQVQSEIAGQVASALDVALSPTDQRRLAERPTQDMAAYDLYLKAEAAAVNRDPASLGRAVELMEQAVALDSTFGIAWARLAETRSRLYAVASIRPPRAPIERALARAEALAPAAVETYYARAVIATIVHHDTEEMLAAVDSGLARYPANPELLRARGALQLRSGRTDEGIATMRQALALDPRSEPSLRNLAANLLNLGRWAEAREMARRALEVAPGNLASMNVIVTSYLAEGDLPGARRAIAGAPAAMDRRQLLAYLAIYGDQYWPLTPAQQDTVLALATSYFFGDPGSRALVFAQIWHQRGDTARTRLWADSARRGFERTLRVTAPNPDPQIHALRGLALALEGRFPEAVTSAERCTASPDATASLADYCRHQLARIHLLAGDQGAALDLIEPLVHAGSELTPGMLRIDPALAPLRGNPRFERLLAGTL
ncbi:MAG TPA: protein kinase [Gemmatimonadaceae bacterium]|nr:protein kinase [Gemmatimonadaceae bacterium]